MTHPPTQCDRKLFLDDHGKPIKATPEDIENSVKWYERNWENISAAIANNLTIEGVTYAAKWQEVFDYKTLPAWREGMPKRLAEAYVYGKLRRLWRAMETRR